MSLNHLISLVALCAFFGLPLYGLQHRVELIRELDKEHLGWVIALAVLVFFLWQPRKDEGCMSYLDRNPSLFGPPAEASDCRDFLGVTMWHTIGRLRLTVPTGRLFGDSRFLTGQRSSVDFTPEVAGLGVGLIGLTAAKRRKASSKPKA